MEFTTFNEIVDFIRGIYKTDENIPLHEPRFWGNEKKYLNDCIDSTFVSSVGKYVDKFEDKVAEFCGAKCAVAVVNGTQALFIGLKLIGARPGTEIITQSLTFVATANAIAYTGASPIFIDVDVNTMGLSPASLRRFLEEHTEQKDGTCWNKTTQKQIVGCVPMHTCGFPAKIIEIKEICEEFFLTLVEDSAESLGSYVGGTHTGLFGKLGVFSFNGNKIITSGGGGMVVTNDEALAKNAKHLTTTAKKDHPWEFNHDEVGYNFRMPNINAALGVSQIEHLTDFLICKRDLANEYKTFFDSLGINSIQEREGTKANYWLNAILLENQEQRNDFLKYANRFNIMARCLWSPMHTLPMYKYCEQDTLENTKFLYERVVNIPSSVRN